MSVTGYLQGTSVLVGVLPAAAARPALYESGQYLLIRVRDISGAIKKQAGAFGGVASSGYSLAKAFVPNTIESYVYDQMVPEMRKQFASEGVVADVSVVSVPPPDGMRPSSEVIPGILVGAGGVGLLWAGSYLVRKLFLKKVTST